MIIGIPKEIKEHEYRVSVTPAGVHDLVGADHIVLVEDAAGLGSGIENELYEREGAKITNREEIFKKAEMIIKVKEPIADEFRLLQEGQVIYTYLHLAPAPDLASELLKKKNNWHCL